MVDYNNFYEWIEIIGGNSALHMDTCEDEYCEACQYLLEFYSACDSCGHWMNKESAEGSYFYHQDTGHTYCMHCEENLHP